MMMKLTISAATLALLLAGCGSKSRSDSLPASAAEPTVSDSHGEAHEGEPEHAHGAAGGPVDKFHEQLAPLWHAPESPQRVTDTCAAAGTLHGLANDIVKAGAPEGAAPDYLDAAQKLVDAVAALHVECGTAERKEFGARFAAVHEAFHGVAERSAH